MRRERAAVANTMPATTNTCWSKVMGLLWLAILLNLIFIAQQPPRSSGVSTFPHVTTYPFGMTKPPKRDWQAIGAKVREGIDNDTWAALSQSRGIFDATVLYRSEATSIRYSLTQLYGNISQPHIMGLDTCATYRSLVPFSNRTLITAGLFSTGTNLMDEYLRQYIHGVSWNKSTPWETPVALPVHSSSKPPTTTLTRVDVRVGLLLGSVCGLILSFVLIQRRTNRTWRQCWLFVAIAMGVFVVTLMGWPVSHSKPRLILDGTSLPIVMIRDPYHWMQRMCETPSAAQWNHTPQHCPNLVPTEPVSIEMQGHRVEWDSLVHLYNEWYHDYVEADFPRMVVRYEDLLLHSKAVVSAIADCVGFNLTSDVRYRVNPDENIGNDVTLRTMVDPRARVKNLTALDLAYAATHWNATLLESFHYIMPSNNT